METYEPQIHNFRRLLDQLNVDLSERLEKEDNVLQRILSNSITTIEVPAEVLNQSSSFLASM